MMMARSSLVRLLAVATRTHPRLPVLGTTSHYALAESSTPNARTWASKASNIPSKLSKPSKPSKPSKLTKPSKLSKLSKPSKLSNLSNLSRPSKLSNKLSKPSNAKPTTNKKRLPSQSGTEGRIALQDPNDGRKLKKKSGEPLLCAGCGTQVIAGKADGGSLFSTGADAAASDTPLSKTKARKARYFDLDEASKKGGSSFLCKRCRSLKSDNIWAAYDAIQDVDADVFTKQLSHIVGRRRFGMCIVVVDATDPEHSAPKHLRRSIGKAPALLVISKCDLLPRLSPRDMTRLRSKIEDITGLKFMNCFAISAHTGSGVFDLCEYLLLNLGGRDVFCVGAANVGKSTLVQKLAATITPNIYLLDKSKRAKMRKEMATQIPVTTSHLPGTTLQAVRISCFSSARHALWDTPGIIQPKAVQYSLFPPHLMEPLARARPISLTDAFEVRNGHSLLIEAAWMDPRKEANDEENDDESSNADESSNGNNSNDHFKYNRDKEHQMTYAKPLPPLEDTCVLARMDAMDCGQGHVYVKPWLHPSLRVRVVPTTDAPTTACIPKHHIDRVQSQMKTKFKNLVTSRPLAKFVTPQNPEGYLLPTDKEVNFNTGRVYMDVVFASLGWISVTHPDQEFKLQPWCIQGSVFSKRPALYGMNFSQKDVEHQQQEWEEDIKYLESKDARQRLDQAAREGRSNSGKRKKKRSSDDEFARGDDEWFL